MSAYKSNSAQDIIYIDHTSSGLGASISQSSADPVSLANLMRETVIIVTPRLEIIDKSAEIKEDVVKEEKVKA